MRKQHKQRIKTKPLAVRLTDEERKELNRCAGEMAVGAYVRSVLFADEIYKRRTRGSRAPVKDHTVLAEVLACLGSSHIGESLERLADASESGVLQFDEKAPAAIKKASEDILVIRLLLMKALGFQVDLDEVNESVSQAFARAARDDQDLWS